jgi:hypothetical protein
MLRYTFRFWLAVILLAFTNNAAQTEKEQQKLRYVLVPQDNTMVVVASQPGCPLRIERAQLLVNTEKNHDVLFQYDLRNAGRKPIRDFNLVFFSSEGNSGSISDHRLRGKILLPGEVIRAKEETAARTVLPLSSELRRKLKLDSPVKAIVVLMVWTVDFNDGSTFSDEKNLKAAKAFFEELDVRH